MKTRIAIPLIAIGTIVFMLVLLIGFENLYYMLWPDYTEHQEINPAKTDPDFLADDKLADKHLEFDPKLIDSRSCFGMQINKSDAVIKLDVPGEYSEILYPTYADAVKAAMDKGENVLLSINYIDGKAKQIDDGMYAAIDLAYYKGVKDTFESHVSLVRRFYEKTKGDPECEAYFAAGMHYAGDDIPAADSALKAGYMSDFDDNELRSKPIGFYTWSEDLKQCFRFLRFFQEPLNESLTKKICAALEKDAGLMKDYKTAVGFYDKLSNYHTEPSLADIIADKDYPDVSKTGSGTFLPPSDNKESILFRPFFDIFGNLPDGVNLMHELIKAIRDGKVDLRPDEKSGWYEYQVYALETLLLPSKGEEVDKLLLTQNYKKRMVEAFKAMITTRRETHARQMICCIGEVDMKFSPRLRIEPCPTYYKRQARGYAFLLNFLTASVGEKALSEMHGLRKGGERWMTLWDELNWIRNFYYGLYLLSCEDIGHKPVFMDGETVDEKYCIEVAAEWIKIAFDDEDMKIDTRVCIPVAQEEVPRTTHIWATIGVKLVYFEASFATPPSVRDDGEVNQEWRKLTEDEMETGEWVIPTVQFIEVKRKGWSALTRKELREICDREKTKDKIAAAIGREQ